MSETADNETPLPVHPVVRQMVEDLEIHHDGYIHLPKDKLAHYLPMLQKLQSRPQIFWWLLEMSLRFHAQGHSHVAATFLLLSGIGLTDPQLLDAVRTQGADMEAVKRFRAATSAETRSGTEGLAPTTGGVGLRKK